MTTRLCSPVRLTALLAIALVLAAGCGVPEDGQPRTVGEDEQVYRFLLGEASGTTTTTEAAAPAELGPGSVFWVVEGEDELTRIVEVEIEIRVDSPTKSALNALFLGPTEEDRESGFGTRIPEGLNLVDVRQGGQDNVVVVGLESEIEGGIEALGGERLQQLLAQIVYTATASGHYDSVRFTENNEGLSVPNQEGTASDIVTRDDYSLVATPPEPESPSTTTGSTTTVP